jgi:hypothetical protein
MESREGIDGRIRKENAMRTKDHKNPAIVLMAALFLSAPVSAASRETRPAVKAVLQEVLSIGGLSEDKLLMWVGLAVDEDGRMFVTDALDFSIKVFDAGGGLLRRAARAGSGPGRFQAIRELGLSRASVYVTDQYRPEISVFNKELEFERVIPISRALSCLRVGRDDTLAGVGLTMNKGERASVWLADRQGRTTGEIIYGIDPHNPAADRACFAFSGKDLVLAYNFKDRVERIDRQGRKAWSRSLFHLPDVPLKSFLGMMLPKTFIYKDVAVDSAGRIYILGGGFANPPSREVYVLTPEGELLTKITLPDTSHCLAIDSKDFLYSRADDGLTIKKFKVLFVPEGKQGSSGERRP